MKIETIYLIQGEIFDQKEITFMQNRYYIKRSVNQYKIKISHDLNNDQGKIV